MSPCSSSVEIGERSVLAPIAAEKSDRIAKVA